MITVQAADGAPEVGPGTDLAGLVSELFDLADGDVVAVTSKVVSKAEGRVRPGTRDDALVTETRRVVARRGATTIVRTRHGLTLAAAGIDASNVEPGSVVLLPEDPDASARRIREDIHARTGRNVGVLVTDTAGRAWREGQTDIAIGAAGLRVLIDLAGSVDAHGNELAVTAPAVADELAGAAELAQGKLAARPFAVVRGRADLVLLPGEHGAGASALLRPEGADLFGYGAREAVVRALRGDPDDRPAFGAPADPEELTNAIRTALPQSTVRSDADSLVVSGVEPGPVVALAFAFGWDVVEAAHGTARDAPGPDGLRFRPANP
ncbi:MAG TPA: coenzyme F420-0:L-glutamate ligase [Nocardioides sp.]|nr:coenzyme F420-0:L-glutamate ligase [Nocardioides sp.]